MEYKKEQSPQETSPDTLRQPWHEMDDYEWNETSLEHLLTEIEKYTPLAELRGRPKKIRYVNVLLMGRIASGKSSFFNTVESVIKGRLSIRSRTDCAASSLAKSLDVYKVKGRRTFRHLRFRMLDCRCLEEDQSINSRDVEAILDGHVMDGYVFNQGTPISKDNSKFRKDPSIGDRVHCVLFVVDGSNPPEITMSQNVEKQVKELQELMNGRRIPQLILLTKIDTIVTVKEDLSKVFHSRSVLEMRDKVAMSFGLPSYTVLPMQNLANSRTASTEIKMLTLYNLRQILRAADDYLENFEDEILADTNQIPCCGLQLHI
ncbi:interferon-induced protein 44-like isoform X1 [Ostrea edulis]|uniref:interferon-induced protein 44-like isoform X1 n=2 Tax=Ostrea edulis TaxID=37623 RepID=UPI0024AFC69A|nr:interferon-induced protein 44-like isoform X1 [Ostrea edulis]